MSNGKRHIVFLALLVLAIQGTMVQGQGGTQKVLIKAARPYNALVRQIEQSGGRVTHQFKYWDGLAAELPMGALGGVTALAGESAVSKDHEVPLPVDVDSRLNRLGFPAATDPEPDGVSLLGEADVRELASVNPQGYLLNGAIANVTPLHAQGFTGAGIVVAVIDSGIRPIFPHIAGGVIGCDDFVGSGACSADANSGHGTFVAGMIRANVVFTFAAASALRQAVLAECPACFFDPPTNTQIPMVGTAPLSSIYALRVFGPTGGAPVSRILAAAERAIELRELFDAGTGGANVQVVNLSLGGSSVFPGRDMFDMAISALLDHDIVPVIAAGNAGPSSLTLGSPGSAFSALTVGAASLPHNERILRRAQFGPVVGAAYRPFLGAQTAFFSSRGPNPDGRLSPHVVANGFACYGQGTGPAGSISLGSGTSFATPSVSGVAALLRQAHRAASARQVRNAIIMTANPTLLADDSTFVDQGNGYVDGAAARALLATGTVPDTVEPPVPFNKNVKTNVAHTTPLTVRTGFVSESASGLKPGERYDILYDVPPNTRQVVVSLSNVTPSLPPAQQNQLFGDDILLAIHSAKTSSIGEAGDYKFLAFTTGGTFVVNDPEPGLMRVTVNGDWINAGEIAAHVMIVPLQAPLPQFTVQAKIAQSDELVVPIHIPAGVKQADFRLSWREDWGRYPTSDVDMVLVRPNATFNLGGATLNNPERVIEANPAPGTWAVIISGFEVHTTDDRFQLRVTLDGKVVR